MHMHGMGEAVMRTVAAVPHLQQGAWEMSHLSAPLLALQPQLLLEAP